MVIKNVSQTSKVPSSFLIKDINMLSPEIKLALIDYARKANSAENTDSLRAETIALIPESMKKELAAIGCELPSDMVDLTMRLGDFLYHIYAIHTKKPESPLAIKRLEKRLLDLAEVFDKTELEVPSDVLEIVTDVLSDDKKWSISQFGATVVVDGEQKYIGLTSHGAKIFVEVIEAAVDACMEVS